MISLLDVNSYASIALDYVKAGDKDKAQELLTALEAKSADRKEILDKLQAKAEESESDNAWNRYESADEAYGYAEQLSNLVSDFLWGDDDYEDLEWQLDDLISNTLKEAYYRLERSQW